MALVVMAVVRLRGGSSTGNRSSSLCDRDVGEGGLTETSGGVADFERKSSMDSAAASEVVAVAVVVVVVLLPTRAGNKSSSLPAPTEWLRSKETELPRLVTSGGLADLERKSSFLMCTGELCSRETPSGT